MPLKILPGKNLPIGIDLGSSSAKIAQLRRVEGDFELLAADAEEIPRACRNDPEQRMAFLADALRRIIKSKPFHGRQAVLSMPADSTFVHHLKLPMLRPQDLPQALKTELRGKLPYDVDDAVIRHVVAGEIPGDAESRQEIIVVSAPRVVLEDHLAMSRRAKLDVVGINVEPCAVVECFARLFRRRADATRTILFIDMGSESTQVVFSHGNSIVFARNLDIGGHDLDSSLAEARDLPIEQANALRRRAATEEADNTDRDEIYALLEPSLDALGGELNKCLRYHESVFRNRAVERAIFLGGQAYDKRLCQSLAQRLNLPAQIGDPLLRIKRVAESGPNDGLDLRHPRPDWAVAVGLSIGSAAAA